MGGFLRATGHEPEVAAALDILMRDFLSIDAVGVIRAARFVDQDRDEWKRLDEPTSEKV
jgi:hypothetical protein